jgi:hypothetical protein
MIEHAILEAVQASRENPGALAALALIEFALAQEFESGLQSGLRELIDLWGQTLVGIDMLEIDRLKKQIESAALSRE